MHENAVARVLLAGVAVFDQAGQAEPVDQPAQAQDAEGEEVETAPAVAAQVKVVQAREAEREAQHVGVVHVLPVGWRQALADGVGALH